MDTIAGIDYGSKLAGTTAIAYNIEDEIFITGSEKKKDADRFILQEVQRIQAGVIFIDAPLSLPAVYRSEPGYEDYFYRLADRELSAMSPMFLGGLTARAMQLSQQLKESGIQIFEVYPSALARQLLLEKERYKKDKSYLAEAAKMIINHLEKFTLPNEPNDWHQLDALLAFCSGIRYLKGISNDYGDSLEGQIFV